MKSKEWSKSQIENENIPSQIKTVEDGECLPVPVVNALEVTAEG